MENELNHTPPKRHRQQASESESESEASEVLGDQTKTANENAFIDVNSFLKATAGEAYLHGVARPSKTSNARFSSDFEEPFTRESYLKALSTSTNVKQEQTTRLLTDLYETRFALWQVELKQGYSLLFHGAGSKRNLLNHFARKSLAKHGNVVVANGYASSVSIVDILALLENHLHLEPKSHTSTAQSTLALEKNEMKALAICKAQSSKEAYPFYLLIHNIDSPILSTARSKNVLALLARHPKIHLLASIDHIQAMLLFPSSLASSIPVEEDVAASTGIERGFAFLHHHVPTFEQYTEENIHSDTLSSLFPPSVYPPFAGLKGNMSSTSKMHGTLSVIASLNENAKSLFRNLASKQLAAYESLPEEEVRGLNLTKSSTTPSIATSQLGLFTYARDNFLASTETQMIALLSEFRDHDIVLSSTEPPAGYEPEIDEEVTEWMWIKLSKDVLKGVLERME